MQAQDVMTTVVATIDGGATVQEAAKLMLERRIKRVPVLEAGRLVGIVQGRSGPPARDHARICL